MDGRLPSINCFIKKKGNDCYEEESMTDIMNLSDYSFLTDVLNSNEPNRRNDNSYLTSFENDAYMPNQVNNPSHQMANLVHENVDHMKYHYQGQGEAYINNNNMKRNGDVCQEINLYQDNDGNWIKCPMINFGNRNQNEYGHQNVQGTGNNLVRNHDTTGGLYSRFDQINAYDVNSVPGPYHSSYVFEKINDNSNSAPSSTTNFDDNSRLTAAQGQVTLASNYNAGFSGINVERRGNGDMTFNDMGYRNTDKEAIANVSHGPKYFMRVSNQDGINAQGNLGYSLREDNELTPFLSPLYGFENNSATFINDNRNNCPANNFSHQNNINKEICSVYEDFDYNNQTQTNSNDNVTALVKITPNPFGVYKENERENIDTEQIVRINNGVSEIPRQSFKSHGQFGVDQIVGRDFLLQENDVLQTKRLLDTGQGSCDDDNVNNNYENGTAPADYEMNILPTFSSLLERKDRDSSMSSSSSSSSSSNDGPSDDLLDDLVRDLLNSKGKKKESTYIALISKAIFSSPQKKMLLSDIYDYLSKMYKLDTLNSQAWRNSVRHNLSLNECFVKHKRLGRGRGHYWSIHPACVEDFAKGDFRRRQARRLAQRNTKGGTSGGSRGGNGDQNMEVIDSSRARQSS